MRCPHCAAELRKAEGPCHICGLKPDDAVDVRPPPPGLMHTHSKGVKIQTERLPGLVTTEEALGYSPKTDKIKDEVKSSSASLPPACSRCKTPLQPGDVFCSKCGFKIPKYKKVEDEVNDSGMITCGECGVENDPERTSCLSCSSRL
ncbi:zinc ribbon domain-containing protein [Myxococcota bacterium]|nr:zinc ribbon domain-containing protein [Myxococcota bacterium]